MFERVLEDWLDNASERGFQTPFCHALVSEGHTIVHSTRHGAMEMGKDVVSIAPDGVPCAYQLKAVGGQRLTLSRFRNDLQPQLLDLATGAIDHPSLPQGRPHRSYVVLNGTLDEEVQRSISDFNRKLRSSGFGASKIIPILRGHLLAKFRALGSAFWPQDPPQVSAWLEIYGSSGVGPMPRAKLAQLAEGLLGLDKERPPLPASRIREAIGGASILLNWAITPFVKAENHLAEVHARVIMMMAALGASERVGAARTHWEDHVSILEDECLAALERLIDEAAKRDWPVEGDPLTDFAVYRVRLTELLGWISLYGLRDLLRQDGSGSATKARDLVTSGRYQGLLWGEHAIPQILTGYLFLRQVRPGLRTEHVLSTLAGQISSLNDPSDTSNPGLPNPYYDADEVVPRLLGLEEWSDDWFRGWSYALETIVCLMARENLKQSLKLLWPRLSRVLLARFQPKKLWNWYRWTSAGTLKLTEFARPTEWRDLQRRSAGAVTRVPLLLRSNPIRYLMFVLTFPHRLDAEPFLHMTRQLAKSLRSTG